VQPIHRKPVYIPFEEFREVVIHAMAVWTLLMPIRLGSIVRIGLRGANVMGQDAG
jgi:hypothetical protein